MIFLHNIKVTHEVYYLTLIHSWKANIRQVLRLICSTEYPSSPSLCPSPFFLLLSPRPATLPSLTHPSYICSLILLVLVGQHPAQAFVHVSTPLLASFVFTAPVLLFSKLWAYQN